MKTTIVLVITVVLSTYTPFGFSTITESKIETSDCYFPLNIGNSWTYKYVGTEHTLKEEITEKNIQINKKGYFKKIRTYSWGDNSEAYYRNEKSTFYNYNKEANSETISIPNEIFVGKSWQEADNSCHYEITNINATIKTPIKTYAGLLQIKVKLLNESEDKFQEYDLYYMKGIGQIASRGNGKLFTYLTDYTITIC